MLCAGWFHAHNALRADLAALQGMLDLFESQVRTGGKIDPVQQKAATRFLDCFLKFLHHHHHNGEPVAGFAAGMKALLCRAGAVQPCYMYEKSQPALAGWRLWM